MKEMSELKGFNMERILLRNKNGYMCFGYYKDGMIEIDGEFSRPLNWDAWIRVNDLKKLLSKTK